MKPFDSEFEKNSDEIARELRKKKIIPVLVLDNIEDGLKMCEIVNRKGLGVVEITFRSEAAEKIISEATRKFPNLIVGAGTILNKRDLKKAFKAGAKFAVAPGLNPIVVSAAVEREWPFFPGVATPSEIEQGLSLGVRRFKFFPAETLGGVKYLESVSAPYKHLGLSFIPTGGVNAENVKQYLALPEVVACGGTWIGKSSDIKAGAWDKIETSVVEAVAIAGSFK